MGRITCHQLNLTPVASAGKIRMAMGTLDELGKMDESVRRDGHVVAHAIGIADVPGVVSPGNKAECYSAVGEEIWVLDPTTEGRTQLCSKAEPAYLDSCLYGTRVNATAPQTLIDVWNAVDR